EIKTRLCGVATRPSPFISIKQMAVRSSVPFFVFSTHTPLLMQKEAKIITFHHPIDNDFLTWYSSIER
ncbi:MAG: hypothetical protein IJD70_09130, partial [Clostridia bacterium]|nr:hypothetical protein [Clostridia bacterium]